MSARQFVYVSCRVFRVLRFSVSYSDDDQDSSTIHEDRPVLRAASAFCNLRSGHTRWPFTIIGWTN